MAESKKNEKEFLVVGSDGQEEINLPVMFEALLVKLMGEAIDCGRMSIQNDRAFQQFERSVKDKTYNLVKMAGKILADHGIEDISNR